MYTYFSNLEPVLTVTRCINGLELNWTAYIQHKGQLVSFLWVSWADNNVLSFSSFHLNKNVDMQNSKQNHTQLLNVCERDQVTPD